MFLKSLPQWLNCPCSVKLTLVTQSSNMKTHRHNIILVVYYLEQKFELYNSNNIMSTSQNLLFFVLLDIIKCDNDNAINKIETIVFDNS